MCIALTGQVYGQLDGINRAMKESLGKKELLFNNEFYSFQEYSANLFDYTREQVRINNRSSLNNVVISMNLIVQSKGILGSLATINQFGVIYAGMLGNKCPHTTLKAFLKTYIVALYNDSDTALELIKNSEKIFVGTHAQNILNMKKDLRKLMAKCSELLEEA